jgi:hypothetical protein
VELTWLEPRGKDSTNGNLWEIASFVVSIALLRRKGSGTSDAATGFAAKGIAEVM